MRNPKLPNLYNIKTPFMPPPPSEGSQDPPGSTGGRGGEDLDQCTIFANGPGSITVHSPDTGPGIGSGGGQRPPAPNFWTVTIKLKLTIKCFCEHRPPGASAGGHGAMPKSCKGNKFKFYYSRNWAWEACNPLAPPDDNKCTGSRLMTWDETISLSDFIAGGAVRSGDEGVGGIRPPYGIAEEGDYSEGDDCVLVSPNGASNDILSALWSCGATYVYVPHDHVLKVYLCFNSDDIADCIGQIYFTEQLCEDNNEDTITSFLSAYLDKWLKDKESILCQWTGG